MPCFKPLKDYLLSLTEELIDEHSITGPFLEIGCGDGSLTELLCRKGMSGLAIDLSDRAVAVTSGKIGDCNGHVEVARSDLFSVDGSKIYNTILIYDVLEHIEDDAAVVCKIKELLRCGGFLLVSVPTRMSEWRWDDELYGHVRRYDEGRLRSLFDEGELKIICQWDITFPFIYILRRMYTAIIRPPTDLGTRAQRTEASAFHSASGQGLLQDLVAFLPVWKALFTIQNMFRTKGRGCNTLMLVRRDG